MLQKKLHKTVETIASKHFDTEEAMLVSVLKQIIEDESIDVIGARIWKIDQQEEAYKILFQTGKVEKIDPNFLVRIRDYPEFDYLAKERTILSNETNIELRKKGIFQYSASGVGDKIKIRENLYYEYLLALNSSSLNEEHIYTLNIIATALTAQIKQRRTTAKAKDMKADLNKARELQRSILPQHEYFFHNYELFGVTYPAAIVGGDFFDYLEIGDDKDRLGVVVGDAASKGVSAAAEAMYISGAIRMASNFEIKIALLMKRINQLVNKIFSDDKFASLFYGELSTDKRGLFLYANAGHNPPMFLKKNGNKIHYLESTGPVIGPVPFAKYTLENVNFDIGDLLLIYSDGVTDSANADFKDFGEERLKKIFRKVSDRSSKEVAYAIMDEVIKFSSNGQYSDDKTIVVIKRNS